MILQYAVVLEVITHIMATAPAKKIMLGDVFMTEKNLCQFPGASIHKYKNMSTYMKKLLERDLELSNKRRAVVVTFEGNREKIELKSCRGSEAPMTLKTCTEGDWDICNHNGQIVLRNEGTPIQYCDCICNVGYKGRNCENHSEPKSMFMLIFWAAVAVEFMVLIFAVCRYGNQRVFESSTFVGKFNVAHNAVHHTTYAWLIRDTNYGSAPPTPSTVLSRAPSQIFFEEPQISVDNQLYTPPMDPTQRTTVSVSTEIGGRMMPQPPSQPPSYKGL